MIAIVLPAFNEEKSLPLVIKQIRIQSEKHLSEEIRIIVVDDGSTDNTADCVKNLSGNDLVLVQHQSNRGLGEAIKTGMLEALHLSPDVSVIVTMDSDNTHPPGLLMRMILAIDEGNDVVIASRYRPGAQVIGLTRDRELLSLGMSWLFRLFLPIHGVRDYSCGYRAYRSDIIQNGFKKWGDQFINQSGFSCMLDILLKLNQIHAIFYELPLILRYDQKQGKSKMKVSETIKNTLRILIHERFRLFYSR